jgi:hypothetical protein
MGVRDGKGRSIFGRIEGNSIIFIIGRTGLPEAEAQLDRAAARLRSLPQKR